MRLWAVKQGDEVAESAPVNRLRVGRLTVEVIELTKIMGQVLTICFESLCVVPKKNKKNVQFNMQVFMKCMLWSICLLNIHEILGG